MSRWDSMGGHHPGELLVRPLSFAVESPPRLAHVPALVQSPHDPGLTLPSRSLIDAFRVHGHRAARLDPLADVDTPDIEIAELEPRTHGFPAQALARCIVEFGGVPRSFTAADLLRNLRRTYCATVAIDCGHLRSSEQQQWLYAAVEQRMANGLAAHEAIRVLDGLVAAEAMEHYQRANYPKHKQFSLEGSESLVTLLNAMAEHAARLGAEDIVLGMPHRGRLNVLRNVFDLPAAHLLSLFTGRPDPSLAAWDVKDHLGYTTRKTTRFGEIQLRIAHNPSHLGSIAPVVCGIARALQDRKAHAIGAKVVPVLVHGDATFPAQGVITETLNLAQTRGYGVGGTVHVIHNNQIGSTVSNPADARSTLYCADLARAFDAPILHVNADDPEAVVAVIELAVEFRLRFGADVVVDHVGYRRFGHFGGDDPTMTQPAMQRRIRAHPGVAVLYSDRLVRDGVVANDDYERRRATELRSLREGDAEARAAASASISPAPDTPLTRHQSAPVRTSVPLAQLHTILSSITTVPDRFALHPGIETILQRWRAIDGDDLPHVDWCLAENLAYGALLANGFNVRLSGLDVGRGSFFHRYHVWHHQARDSDCDNVHVPLRHLSSSQGTFSIFESPVSEEGVLGFEYGYSLQSGRDLVVWEAQFGDFVNNAQVIIDQYIATGERKWGCRSGLVVLLPHGHEGGGPEHTSGYLGRFLQLCAEDNLCVAMPSTAAQMFHLLRRQALSDPRQPLVVMTPKMALYGEHGSYASFRDLAHGEFAALLADPLPRDAAAVRSVIVTSGKLYYDLLRARGEDANTMIVRAEQLYPFPTEQLARVLAGYAQVREVVWAQEETRNHGAWNHVRDAIEAALPPGVALRYAGRPAAAACAVCDIASHRSQQQAILRDALRHDTATSA